MNNVVSLNEKRPVKVQLNAEELAASGQALRRIGEMPLPAKSAYWVGKTSKKILAAVAESAKDMQKRHYALVMEYGAEVMKDSPVVGEPPVPTGNFQVTPENNDAFQAAWNDMIAETVEVEVLPLSLDLFEGVKIIPADAAALDWLFVG